MAKNADKDRVGFFLRIPRKINEKLLKIAFQRSRAEGHQVSKNAIITEILEKQIR